jgi:hypothetical protein
VAGAGAAIAAVRAEMEALRAQFLELEERTGMLVTPPPIRSGLNMSRRTQAVRMLHRGATPEQIATAVGFPLAEARLLTTVERLRSSETNRPPALQ